MLLLHCYALHKQYLVVKTPAYAPSKKKLNFDCEFRLKRCLLPSKTCPGLKISLILIKKSLWQYPAIFEILVYASDTMLYYASFKFGVLRPYLNFIKGSYATIEHGAFCPAPFSTKVAKIYFEFLNFFMSRLENVFPREAMQFVELQFEMFERE